MSYIKNVFAVGLIILAVSGCCDKCNSEFSEDENDLMVYNEGDELRFSSNLQGTAAFRAGAINSKLNAKKCTNLFGGEGACIISQEIHFSRLEGSIRSIDIKMRKVDDVPDLEITIDEQFLTLRSPLSPTPGFSQQTPSSLTVNGMLHEDVFQRSFDPNSACRFPEECVDIGDVVAIRYSLSAGLLQFEVHRGLQEPNEVFTIN